MRAVSICLSTQESGDIEEVIRLSIGPQSIAHCPLTLDRRLIKRRIVTARHRSASNYSHRRLGPRTVSLAVGSRLANGRSFTVRRWRPRRGSWPTKPGRDDRDTHLVGQLRINDGTHDDSRILGGELLDDLAHFLELTDRQIHARGDVHQNAVRSGKVDILEER